MCVRVWSSCWSPVPRTQCLCLPPAAAACRPTSSDRSVFSLTCRCPRPASFCRCFLPAVSRSSCAVIHLKLLQNSQSTRRIQRERERERFGSPNHIKSADEWSVFPLTGQSPASSSASVLLLGSLAEDGGEEEDEEAGGEKTSLCPHPFL